MEAEELVWCPGTHAPRSPALTWAGSVSPFIASTQSIVTGLVPLGFSAVPLPSSPFPLLPLTKPGPGSWLSICYSGDLSHLSDSSAVPWG